MAAKRSCLNLISFRSGVLCSQDRGSSTIPAHPRTWINSYCRFQLARMNGSSQRCDMSFSHQMLLPMQTCHGTELGPICDFGATKFHMTRQSDVSRKSSVHLAQVAHQLLASLISCCQTRVNLVLIHRLTLPSSGTLSHRRH